jgi:hypothetical protein
MMTTSNPMRPMTFDLRSYLARCEQNFARCRAILRGGAFQTRLSSTSVADEGDNVRDSRRPRCWQLATCGTTSARSDWDAAASSSIWAYLGSVRGQ